MDFAKRMLEKYGWSEGQGLGKDSTGITTAIKPKVKLNTFGLGHDSAQEFTYRWWEDAFNDAASNVTVENTVDGVRVDTVTDNAPEISVVKRSKIKRDKAKFGAFIKRETLTNDGLEQALQSTSEPIKEVEWRLPKIPATLTDEQLFQACGGLTAHKAARHGHKLSGKLQRVREQEESLLKALQKNLIEESKNIDSNSSEKRRKKHNGEERSELDILSSVSMLSEQKEKKKRKTENLDGRKELIKVTESRQEPCDKETLKKKSKLEKNEETEATKTRDITQCPHKDRTSENSKKKKRRIK